MAPTLRFVTKRHIDYCFLCLEAFPETQWILLNFALCLICLGERAIADRQDSSHVSPCRWSSEALVASEKSAAYSVFRGAEAMKT
eukprot:362683-Amphidinium_carterae.1